MRKTMMKMNKRWVYWLGIVVTVTINLAVADMQSDYQNLVINTNGLQNYWTFDSVTVSDSNLIEVYDVVGGKTGVTTGSASDYSVDGQVKVKTGLVGNTAYFPGGTDDSSFENCILIPDSVDVVTEYIDDVNSVTTGSPTCFDLDDGSFTVEALVQTDALAENWCAIVTKGDSTWRIARYKDTEGVQCGASGLKTVYNQWISLDSGLWHHVALCYDASANTITSWLDGVKVIANVTADNTISTDYFLPVMIGGNCEKPEREWKGYIDEVAIYTVALTESQIQERIGLLDTDPSAIDTVDSISYWTGDASEGSFDSNTGWDKTAPGSGDTVVIGKDGQVTCSGVHEIENLEVGSSTDLGGYDSSGPGTLIMTDGALSITGEEHCTIGSGDTGHVIQSGGTLFFAGNDYEIGEYVNGCGTHTMTGGELRIGYWAQDPDFTGGWFMTNDNSAGDDLAIGRERKLDDQGNPQVARGYLTMSGDSVVRVANDAYIPDVGYAELSMTDQALIHVGDDLRSASADNGEGSITMSGDSNLKVEARFTVGDSNGSSVTMTMSDNALVEVGRYMTVAGKDSLGEAGVATLTIEDEATINVGAFLYRGDVGGDPGVTGDDIPTADRVADDQKMYIGAGSEGDGNGTVYQTGSGSFVSIGRELQIGYSSPGQYYLSGGSLVVRGDGPVSGIDFPSGLTSDSGYTDGGGDLIIGYEASGVGLLSIEGGDPNIVRDCTVGLAGEGMLRVKGSDSKITIGGDLGFGGDYLESEGGHGMLDIVLTGSSQSLIDVVGGAEDGTIHGDLHLYDAYLTAGFDGYRPASGDYSSDPLEWLIIRYAGIRTTSEVFALSSSLSDGSANGAIWSVRYDDTAGEIFLQITKVFMTGDADCDGDIDVSDLSTLTEHWLSSEDTVQWSDGDFNDDGTINLLDFEKLARNWMQ